jgi:hypothetical protein
VDLILNSNPSPACPDIHVPSGLHHELALSDSLIFTCLNPFSPPKIPDLPPHGELYPLGTDETERSMPGQEFIRVEGIFTASSDGLTCILTRVGGTREREREGMSASGERERKRKRERERGGSTESVGE